MSSHFSANQYESAFSPQRLQNYQVPLRHKQHPSLRSGCTLIISNNRGHLNSDVPRSPASPWGSFVGTWQAERRPIQLTTRTKLMTHLSQIDQQKAGGSRRSSRATSARVSQASQRGNSATSPRPQSAMESERGDRDSNTVAPDSHNNETGNQSAAGGSKPPTPATETGSKPPTPATETGSKPPTPATCAGSKPHTPATEASSKPSTAATEIGSKPPTPASASKPPTPAPGSPVHPQPAPRATSAVSSRTSTLSSRSRMTASRAQSATVVHGTPRPKAPLPGSSVPSRVSSAA
jgi:hypothetical protein